MKRILIGVTFLIGFLPSRAICDDSFSVGGYMKSFFVTSDFPFENYETRVALKDRLRLEMFWKPTEWIAFESAYDFSVKYQHPTLLEEPQAFEFTGERAYRIEDFKRRLFPPDEDSSVQIGVFHNLDRAVLTLSSSFFDLNLGRQAIAWGSARVVNPTDVIVPFAYNELDTEERPGVDAIRARFPLGLMGEYDIGYIWGEKSKFNHSAYYHRCRLYAWGTDFSALMMVFKKNFIGGIDVTGSIGGAGIWLEGAYNFSRALDDNSQDGTDDYFRTSIGMDYVFSDGTYTFLEYHFNQAGTSEPGEYLYELSTPPYTDGAVFLMGRHYLAPGVTYQITPLIVFSGQALVNINDLSLLFTPQIEYNITQNMYISAGTFNGIGKEPEAAQQGLLPTGEPQSEFGSYPDIYYASFRYYF